jgi:carotenoid cleavage dioxygenase
MALDSTIANPYLEATFAPVREELTVTELEVTGTIPQHLDGRYLRNGPNPVTDPDPRTYHWFIGTGMIHGVRLRDGRAEWYRNRFVRSANVARALDEQPRPGPVHAGLDVAPNTHVIRHAGRTLAIVESGPRPYELTDELETVGPCDFDGTLPGGYTAHPKRDPQTGELHAMSYFWGWGNQVQYSVVGTDGRVRHTVDVEVGGSPMMHDFSLTEDHVVLYDLPVTFQVDRVTADMPRTLGRAVRLVASRFIGRRRTPEAVAERIARKARGRDGGTTIAFPYSWDPDYPARVGVMRRDSDGSDVRWFEIEPCYVFHPLNAFDDGDHIVLDVVRHPKMFATDYRGPNEGPPTLDRWTVDLAAGKVLEERLDDTGQELPRVDERLTGRRHRYGYAVGFDSWEDGQGTPQPDLLLRHDLEAGRTDVRRFEPGQEPSEFVFVPASDEAAEDEGVLMGFVYDASRDQSDLMLLDAATLDTVATVHLPARVPRGFHGSWVPADG